MKLFPSLIGAAVAATVGAVVWVLIRQYANMEIGIVAWGIGVLAGLGAVLASGGKADGATGFGAACIAVLGIAGAKYASATMTHSEVYNDVMEAFGGESGMIVSYADEIVSEREDAGERLVWPAGYNLESASEADHYPEGIWEEAELRWGAVPSSERQRQMDEIVLIPVNMALAAEGEKPLDSFTPVAILKADLSFFDVIWVVLAFASAYKIGSGTIADN